MQDLGTVSNGVMPEPDDMLNDGDVGCLSHDRRAGADVSQLIASTQVYLGADAEPEDLPVIPCQWTGCDALCATSPDRYVEVELSSAPQVLGD
jgi:hypothetical protein